MKARAHVLRSIDEHGNDVLDINGEIFKLAVGRSDDELQRFIDTVAVRQRRERRWYRRAARRITKMVRR